MHRVLALGRAGHGMHWWVAGRWAPLTVVVMMLLVVSALFGVVIVYGPLSGVTRWMTPTVESFMTSGTEAASWLLTSVIGVEGVLVDVLCVLAGLFAPGAVAAGLVVVAVKVAPAARNVVVLASTLLLFGGWMSLPFGQSLSVSAVAVATATAAVCSGLQVARLASMTLAVVLALTHLPTVWSSSSPSARHAADVFAAATGWSASTWAFIAIATSAIPYATALAAAMSD